MCGTVCSTVCGTVCRMGCCGRCSVISYWLMTCSPFLGVISSFIRFVSTTERTCCLHPQAVSVHLLLNLLHGLMVLVRVLLVRVLLSRISVPRRASDGRGGGARRVKGAARVGGGRD